MSAKPLRQPLKRPPDLFALMPLCGVEDFTGSLGAVHRCPVCGGRRPESRPGDHTPPIETLRIHVNAHNEVVVRCHACGLAGSALELVRKNAGLPWSGIGELMERCRVFGDDPVPDGWIERAKDWERFAMKFDQSKEWLRMYVRSGQIKDLHFGEVGLYSGIQVRQTLPGLELASRWDDRDMFYIELYRSLLGLASRLLQKMEWWKLEPHPEYVLGNPSRFCAANEGNEYLVYLRYGGTAKLDLRKADSKSRYLFRWIDLSNEQVRLQGETSGGGIVELSPPEDYPAEKQFKDWLVHVWKEKTEAQPQDSGSEDWKR